MKLSGKITVDRRSLLDFNFTASFFSSRMDVVWFISSLVHFCLVSLQYLGRFSYFISYLFRKAYLLLALDVFLVFLDVIIGRFFNDLIVQSNSIEIVV